ncbi:hypothetical protein B0H16DRAFT_1388833 [Mycena metata]|uniref:BTB domain-containing protein n=1 Tax=Mycena metata TaxID=1033252 RepID=A0AAD7HBR3_9AGAR|nr:hypothetical protein B0H16DRAFT_1388833 [Mycena metata]
MSDLPPAKRQRTESEPITRGHVWYNDGSVVLQAGTTQFRVHWGVISQHSSFFRDLDNLPQPPDPPSMDGCPIIELQDSAEDAENLLKTLYNPLELFNNETAVPFTIIASVVRLGRKYEFEQLLEAAVDRLTFEYPKDLRQYDEVRRSLTRILPYPGIHYDVITLARENNLLSVLPSAYYRALESYTQAALFDGVPRGNNTYSTLLPIDQRRCVVGREKLMQAQFGSANTLGFLQTAGVSDGCSNIQRCTAKKARVLCRFSISGKLMALARVDMNGWNECNACKEHFAEMIEAGRKEVWRQLPLYFELALGWSELKDDL